MERIKLFKWQLLLSCTECKIENNIQKPGTLSTKNEYVCIVLPTSTVELDGLKIQISLTKITFTKFTYHCMLTLFFLCYFLIYFISFILSFYFDGPNSSKKASFYVFICFFIFMKSKLCSEFVWESVVLYHIRIWIWDVRIYAF